MCENSLFACLLSLILLDKHKLDLCSEPSGCFNASSILVPWLCVMPPVANGFCFDSRLNMTVLEHEQVSYISVTKIFRQSVFKCLAGITR